MSLTFSHLPLHQAAIGGGSKAEHKRLTAIGLKHRCPFGEGHSWWLVRRLTAKSAHCQACQPELDPWNPQGRRGEPIAAKLSFSLHLCKNSVCHSYSMYGEHCRAQRKPYAVWRELWGRADTARAKRPPTHLAPTEECLAYATASQTA